MIDVKGVKPSSIDPDFTTAYDGDGEFNIFVDNHNFSPLSTAVPILTLPPPAPIDVLPLEL